MEERKNRRGEGRKECRTNKNVSHVGFSSGSAASLLVTLDVVIFNVSKSWESHL